VQPIVDLCRRGLIGSLTLPGAGANAGRAATRCG
jgi:hypothetical protein